jgi:hypothetical protein
LPFLVLLGFGCAFVGPVNPPGSEDGLGYPLRVFGVVVDISGFPAVDASDADHVVDNLREVVSVG